MSLEVNLESNEIAVNDEKAPLILKDVIRKIESSGLLSLKEISWISG